jgi:hypothetical protein
MYDRVLLAVVRKCILKPEETKTCDKLKLASEPLPANCTCTQNIRVLQAAPCSRHTSIRPHGSIEWSGKLSDYYAWAIQHLVGAVMTEAKLEVDIFEDEDDYEDGGDRDGEHGDDYDYDDYDEDGYGDDDYDDYDDYDDED